jgi:hypothetical protein
MYLRSVSAGIGEVVLDIEAVGRYLNFSSSLFEKMKHTHKEPHLSAEAVSAAPLSLAQPFPVLARKQSSSSLADSVCSALSVSRIDQEAVVAGAAV